MINFFYNGHSNYFPEISLAAPHFVSFIESHDWVGCILRIHQFLDQRCLRKVPAPWKMPQDWPGVCVWATRHLKDFKLCGELPSVGLNDESFRIVYPGRSSQGSDLFEPDPNSCPGYFRCVLLWVAVLFLQQCSSKHFPRQNSRVIS